MLFSIGDRVSAKCQDGAYYPGKIIRVIASAKRYRIHFNDGDEATVTPGDVRVRRMAGKRRQQPKFASRKDLKSLRAELTKRLSNFEERILLRIKEKKIWLQIENAIKAQLQEVYSHIVKLEDRIEAISTNIANLWPEKNATQPNEKSSGTRRSRAEPISELGVIGLPLPGGSADSNAR
jgi:hypothetical protein